MDLPSKLLNDLIAGLLKGLYIGLFTEYMQKMLGPC
jgi:F0F1-type ATP synthase assembly protein I